MQVHAYTKNIKCKFALPFRNAEPVLRFNVLHPLLEVSFIRCYIVSKVSNTGKDLTWITNVFLYATF